MIPQTSRPSYDVTGIILAGGLATRLRKPKAPTKVGGKTLLERVAYILRPHCSEIVLSVRPGQDSGTLDAGKALDMVIVSDHIDHVSPLGGIHAGLAAAREPLCFITGIDYPFLSAEVVELAISRIRDRSAAAAAIYEVGGILQPFHSAWRRKDWIQIVGDALVSGERSPTQVLIKAVNNLVPPVDILDGSDLEAVDPNGISFFNINTPERLEEAEAILKKAKLNELLNESLNCK